MSNQSNPYRVTASASKSSWMVEDTRDGTFYSHVFPTYRDAVLACEYLNSRANTLDDSLTRANQEGTPEHE